MAQVEIDNIIEYQQFRKNPGPMLDRAAQGSPLLLIKGRSRLVVVDVAAYNELVRRAGGEHISSEGDESRPAGEGIVL